MNVLFQSRKTLFSVPGGDTVQILKTKKYLEQLGINITISLDLQPDVIKYDLVHLFNLTRPQETYLQMNNAKKYNKKVVLSPIYVNFTEYDKKARGGIAQKVFSLLNTSSIEYLKILARGLKNKEMHKGTLTVLLNGYFNILKKVVNNVDMFLPNSESEMSRVINDFNMINPKYEVVPNAVDTKIFDYENVKIEEVNKYEGYVLCVARIEGLKGQLNLVRALKNMPYKLVLIGKPAPNHIKYYEEVKKEAGNNVTLIDFIPHDKLPQFYKAAKVHALISWMETTGLSSLEAGLMKCNLVITEKGDTKEYFKKYAFYCKPDDINSIRNAIEKAYHSPFNNSLRKYILENYTWEKTAEATLRGYQKLL